MEQPFKCNPEVGFRKNIEGAMASVLLRHEDLKEHDVRQVLNAVRDDLKRTMKKLPVRKHRLGPSQQTLYDIVLAVCGWCRGADGTAADGSRNHPKAILSAGVLYRYLGSVHADAFGLPCYRYAAGLRHQYAAASGDTAMDTGW